jgi:hypothetical protein
MNAHTALERITVEVILHAVEEKRLVIQADEDSPQKSIGRWGVKIKRREGSLAELEMTENKAIACGLV